MAHLLQWTWKISCGTTSCTCPQRAELQFHMSVWETQICNEWWTCPSPLSFAGNTCCTCGTGTWWPAGEAQGCWPPRGCSTWFFPGSTVVPHHRHLCQLLGRLLSTGGCGSVVRLFPNTPRRSSESYLAQDSTFENYKVEEIVKCLWEFSGHRDGILCTQLPNWVAVTHIVHFPKAGGHFKPVVLCTAEGEE